MFDWWIVLIIRVIGLRGVVVCSCGVIWGIEGLGVVVKGWILGVGMVMGVVLKVFLWVSICICIWYLMSLIGVL